MRLETRHYLPLFATPLLASCIFLLDYDELQGGTTATGGMSAAGGQPDSGATNAGGDAAAIGEQRQL